MSAGWGRPGGPGGRPLGWGRGGPSGREPGGGRMPIGPGGGRGLLYMGPPGSGNM